MTLVSRVTGLVRDIIMANLLGASATADAFFVAFRIPNFLRRIFAEGAFSQAFVPVFAELSTRNEADAKTFVAVSLAWLGSATVALSVVGVVFAEPIVALLAPGFSADPATLATTVGALKIMFPYLACVSLVALSAGILNTHNRFAIPAVTPVMLNLCLIAAMWYLVPVMSDAARALAIGVMVAGGLQVVMQIPSLYRLGYWVRPRWHRQNEAVRRVGRLMLPAVFSVSVAQVNLLVNTFLASFLVTGSVTWLYYSDRLMEFPVGVFGIALATVVLPNLSKQHTQGESRRFNDMLDWALRWVWMIALPATLALILLAVPLLTTLFNYNQFSVTDVAQSALALQAFALGVCGFIFVKVLAPGFFSRQDTTTPMRIAVISVVANIVLSIALVGPLQHMGLALAISLAAWINALLLLYCLWREGVYRPRSGWGLFLVRIVVATALMSGLLLHFSPSDEVWFSWGVGERVSALTALVGAAIALYFAVLWLLGLKPHTLLLKPS